MARVPTSVTRALARSADARVLHASLSVSLAVSSSADRALARPVRPAAAGLGALLMSLRQSTGAAACARVLPVPLPFPCAVSCVPPSAARALACPVCLSFPAAAGPGALPVPLPPLLALCALACALRPSLGAPPFASGPSLCAPLAGTLPRPCTVPPLLDHAPGVPLPLQRRQRDSWRRTRGRRGADGPRPPLGEGGLWRVGLGGAGVSVAGLGVGAVLGALPALLCGCGGSRRGAWGPRKARPLRRRRAGNRRVAQLEELMGRMNPSSYGPTEPHLWLVGKIPIRT